MAWTAPMTFVGNTVLTAAQLNVHLRDNFLETEVAKATSPGGLMISMGNNEIVERVASGDVIDQAESTSSTSYTDLSTVGPKVTVTTGTRALVFLHCNMKNETAAFQSNMSFGITGATTQTAVDSGSIQSDGLTADKAVQWGGANLIDDLTPGVNVFTAKYKVGGSTATFSNRNLTVVPF